MTYETAIAALADPTRRKILDALRGGPISVGAIARTQTVTRPAVSQHLRVLQNARLVSATSIGNRHVYAIRRDGLRDLQNWLQGFWSDVLGAYAVEIDRQIKSPDGSPKGN